MILLILTCGWIIERVEHDTLRSLALLVPFNYLFVAGRR